MAIEYRVYSNDGAGGPVDYTTPIATTSGLTQATPALAPSSDTTFAVRARDTVTGIEERNLDARTRIILDAGGLNITDRPAPPSGLTARILPGPIVLVAWTHAVGAVGAAPSVFRVYVGSPTPDYGTIALSVPWGRLRGTFQGRLSGLAPGTYQVGVRAYNAAGGEEGNTVVAEFTIPAAGPDPVEGLAGSAI